MKNVPKLLLSRGTEARGPYSLDVGQESLQQLSKTAGKNPLWRWKFRTRSRYAEPMDFRAYDRKSHTYAYGGINNHPEGIANTNEIYLSLFGEMPGKQAVIDFAGDVQSETLLVAEPSV